MVGKSSKPMSAWKFAGAFLGVCMIATVCLGLVDTAGDAVRDGAGKKPQADAAVPPRFEVVVPKTHVGLHPFDDIGVLRDKETGVEYVVYSDRDRKSVAIVPRLNADGKPRASKVETNETTAAK